MAFRETQDGASVNIVWLYVNGDNFTNTVWFEKPNFDFSDLTALAATVLNNIQTTLLPAISSDVSLVGTIATDQRQQNSYQATDLLPTPDNGGALSEVEDIATSLVLTLRTPNIGRAYRGRQYIRGIPGTEITNGLISNVFAGAVVNAYSDMRDDAALIGWALSVRTAQVNGVQVDPAILTTISAIEVRNRIPGHIRLTNRRP